MRSLAFSPSGVCVGGAHSALLTQVLFSELHEPASRQGPASAAV